MTEFSSVGNSNTNKSPAFAAALQRAQLIASKIKPDSEGGSSPPHTHSQPPVSGFKRQLDDIPNGPPDVKRAFPNMQDGGMGGPPGGMGSEQVMVPDKMVGLIIGRGGEQITRLQAESGCKIQMSQDSGGMPERVCTLTGPIEAITQARSMIAFIA